MSGVLISVQKVYSSKVFAILAPGRPQSLFTFHYPSSSSELFSFFQEGGRKPAAGPQLTLNTQVQTNTLSALAKV
jgi:hypothetical protein